MTYLITGDPTAKVEGEQITLSLPSGKTEVEASVSLNRALRLKHELDKAIRDALGGFAAPREAEVVSFRRTAGSKA